MLKNIRSKTSEKNTKQKAVSLQSYRMENEYNPEAVPQYFQITINIIEGRKFTWSNPQSANSFVTVVLGKKSYRTTIRRDMEEPFYKEVFVFEYFGSVNELHGSTLSLAVMEPNSFASTNLIGETNIDLGAIWAQPNHQVYHKWAQLSLPNVTTQSSAGFLKIDISIMAKDDVDDSLEGAGDEKPEENILLPPGSEQQRANFIVTIYGVYSLLNIALTTSDSRHSKPPSSFVRVSFCGLVAKTSVQHRTSNPIFNEQISLVEMFPNMNQIIRIEVCCAEGPYNKVLASAHLRLAQISYDGENGFLPTFGPSLIHMYSSSQYGSASIGGDEGPFYKGAILMSLETVVPYYKEGLGTTNVEPANSLQMDTLWTVEDFCVICPILEVSMLDVRMFGKSCGVAITIGDFPLSKNSDEEFMKMANAMRTQKFHYTGPLDVLRGRQITGYLEFPQSFPVLQLAVQLPDFRFRIYRNNMIQAIVSNLETVVAEAECRLKNYENSVPSELKVDLEKTADEAATSILKFFEIVKYETNTQNERGDNEINQYITKLDIKQHKLQKEEMDKIYNYILKNIKNNDSSMNVPRLNNKEIATGMKKTLCNDAKKDVKLLLAKIKLIINNTKKLLFKSWEGWPDIIVWLLNSGSRVAFSKISASDILFSTTQEQRGRNCGRIQTIYLKPLKCPRHMNTLSTGCYCLAGKIELLMWMGLYKQKSGFEWCVPPGYKLEEQEYEMNMKATPMWLECRVFIHRAKLNACAENNDDVMIFVRVNALNSVKETKTLPKCVRPIWNQVLKIKKNMNITMERLATAPLLVLVEVYEKDISNKTDLIGRFQIQPILEDKRDYSHAPKLRWYELYKGREYTGQLLLSLQLLQISEAMAKVSSHQPLSEAVNNTEYANIDDESDCFESLPESLKPKISTYKVDVYWWGLREVNVTRKPCVALNIEDFVLKSEVLNEKKPNCNFPNGRSTHIFKAPLDEYSPPLCISLYDSSTFGRTILLGANVVHNPNKFIINWLEKTEREASLKSAAIFSSNFIQVSQVSCIKKYNQDTMESDSSKLNIKSTLGLKAKTSTILSFFSRKEPNEEECALLPVLKKRKEVFVKTKMKQPEEFDWWSRYAYSQKESGEENQIPKNKITIYNSELEQQPEFSKFKDWCTTLKIYGKRSNAIDKEDQELCGFLKAGIAIYSWPPPTNTIAVSLNGAELKKGYFSDYPNNEPTSYLIRVYVIKATNLVSKDIFGKLNPYLTVDCGKKHINDKICHRSRTTNPIFGKKFEFRCSLPDDYLVTLSVFDHSALATDQLVGSTTIDLEDRIYSKHRACVGMSTEYNVMGATKWRDVQKPSEILKELCLKNYLPAPVFPDLSTVIVNGVEYKDNNPGKIYTSASERRENICVDILHDWHTLPICGYSLVPEHVETRTLYHHDNPDLEKGKLLMWIDIFPFDSQIFIPPPTDITPRKLEEYELRVIIWSVKDVRLRKNKISGKTTSDIYVKAWIGTSNIAQNTDINYNCLFGEGKFNWRMIFNFEYQSVEKKMIVKDKGPFIEVEEFLPPVLVVQVIDSDALFPDDILASLTLTLNSMQSGSRFDHDAQDASNEQKTIDLFSTRNVRGWWTLRYVDQNTGVNLYAGLIDMELSLLPKHNAIAMPVGIARASPSALPEPNRTSISMMSRSITRIKQYLSNRSYKVLIASLSGFLVVALLFAFFCYYIDFWNKVAW